MCTFCQRLVTETFRSSISFNHCTCRDNDYIAYADLTYVVKQHINMRRAQGREAIRVIASLKRLSRCRVAVQCRDTATAAKSLCHVLYVIYYMEELLHYFCTLGCTGNRWRQFLSTASSSFALCLQQVCLPPFLAWLTLTMPASPHLLMCNS